MGEGGSSAPSGSSRVMRAAVSELLSRCSLYGSVITAWNWAAPDRLVLEVDLSNMEQRGYTEEMEDFRPVVLVFEGCSLVDELKEGFRGFTGGDARVIEAEEATAATPETLSGVRLAMMHDLYDGSAERLRTVSIFARDVKLIDLSGDG